MTTDFSFDVFLSHNARDKARVRRLAERLRAAGVRVWLDAWILKPGDDIYLAMKRGLEAARTLVLCLSPAALRSDWVVMERSTVLFRDPSNAGRRFIPLLLVDCDLPDTLRRYKQVDFRRETEAAFEELLAACRPAAASLPSELQPESKKRAEPAKPQPEAQTVLERMLMGHTGWVRSVAISPDGKWIASGSDDKKIKVWDLDKGECRTTMEGHAGYVWCVTIAPDGQRIISASEDGTLRVWDADIARQLAVCRGHKGPIRSVELLPDGCRALSGSWDRTLRVWNVRSGECLKIIEGSDEDVFSIAVAQGGKQAVSGQRDGKLNLWDIETGEILCALKGHTDVVHSIKITPDGLHAISGSRDSTVKAWDLKAGTCIGTLEGHRSYIQSIALSCDGSLVASTGFVEKTVRLWNWKTGMCLQVVEYAWPHFVPISVALSPNGRRLVIGNAQEDGRIYVHRLIGASAASSAELTRRYVNAKVVLVGESGVGKSGLAHRLIEDEFVQTPSTHGMQVWRLDLPDAPPEREEAALDREALLWDLAGQEDYRLIHQLFLNETALALLLFNPQEEDPFAEVSTWLKVLRNAVHAERAREVAKILVAARTDVGGVKISRRKIDRFLEENGVSAYLATSALRGDNCSDRLNDGEASALKKLIAHHIPWAKLPWTSTPRLLADLKNAAIEMKDKREVRLLRFAELAQRLEQVLPKESFAAADMRTAVTLLANHGLVMPLAFGDLVLLRPEVLNGYAAAVIRAARDHTDEIGCVREQDVLDRTIDLTGVDRLEPADEELLMRAIVQTFLDKSLCIAEDPPGGRLLIFPSQYRRERPIPQHPEIFVSYTFSGEWQTVYTTLVVRLWYSREFEHRELWRNAAELQTTKGHTAGLLMERTGEGEGTVSVFFDSEVPDELKVIFIEYVHRHLAKYASDVRRDRRYVCPNPKCRKPIVDLEAVRERLAAGADFIRCQKCDRKVPLIDHIEQRLASDLVARSVLKMEETATRELDTQALEQILTGHLMAICGEANQIFRELTKFDYGIDGEVEFKDDQGTASGKKIYVQLKSGASYLRTRKADGKEVFDLKKPRHLEYWVSQPVDVYLVIRDAEETIRWMNVTRYLKERPASQRSSRQIVFEGEKLDAPAVWRVRDGFFGR